MFKPKWINHSYVLVRINRAKQDAKRGKVGSIIIPPGQVHMGYNQQVGEVVMAGKRIREEVLPGLEPGDELFFHHSVEGTTEKAKKNEFRLNWCVYDNEYGNDPDWKYYVVKEDLIYGYRKAETGEVIMAPDMILAIASDEEEDNRDLKKVGNLYIFKNYKEERAQIEGRIQKLKAEAESHKDRAQILMDEMEKLTRSLNKKRSGTFVPVFVSAKLVEDFGTPIDPTWIVAYQFLGSDNLTPQVTTVEIDGVHFYVLRQAYILYAKKSKKYGYHEVITLDETIRDFNEERRSELRHLSNDDTPIAPGILSK